jgi:hypothetical protein
MERLNLGNYISLKPVKSAPPSNWDIQQETVKKAIYGTYPDLTPQQRDEIFQEFENTWLKRQDEIIGGLMIVMDIVTLPDTLGQAAVLRRGAWNLIKNPKQVGNFFVKLGKIPEAIESLRASRSPAAIGRILEIDAEPVMGIPGIPPKSGQIDTIELIQVKARGVKSGAGTGLAAPVSELTPRIINLANDARNAIVRIGGRVDFGIPIEVAKDADEFVKLAGRSPKATTWAAFYMRNSRKIIVNPNYIRSNQLYRFFTHESMHQVLFDAGIEAKITRSVGFLDYRINEAFTEYISTKVTDGQFIDAYADQVRALRNFLYKYVDDYLNMKGIQRTEENILSVKQWLDKYLYDYAFTNSTQLEDIYNGLYGPNKFGEILRFFFQNVPQVYNQTTMDLADEFKNVFDLTFWKINKLIFPGNVYAVATRINCCYDWPDEGELKKPFTDALQTSQDLGIEEWDNESFEALIKLEWLKNRLNENQKITYENFQELADLDFKVEVETYEAPKSIDLESLPLDTSAPFPPSPSFETGDNLTPPDISDDKTGNQNQTEPVTTPTPTTGIEKSETIIGDCDDPNAWVCEWPDKSWKNCLGTGADKQGLFNDTYCNGYQMWKYQAAQAHGGNGSECDGTWQDLKSNGCGY